MKQKFPLHIHISTLFVVLILLVGSIIAGVGYKLSREMLQSTANDLIGRIGDETSKEIEALIAPAELAMNLISHDLLSEASSFPQRFSRVPFLKEALLGSPALSSVYAGYPNGDFFFLRRVADEAERSMFKAPEDTRYIVQSIEHDKDTHRGRFLFLNGALAELRADDRPDYAASYDPRTRDWFKNASTSATSIKTPPYLFFSNRKVGVTLATRGVKGGSVIGADILLDTLANNLKKNKLTPGTEMALVNGKGFVLAHEDVARLVAVAGGTDAKPSLILLEDFGRPALAAAAKMLHPPAGSEVGTSLKIGGEDWQVNISPVRLPGIPPLYLVLAIPDNELLAAAFKQRNTALGITLLIILIAIPITWGLARGISGPLRALHGEAERIRRFDFSDAGGVRSMVSEVDALSNTMDGMKRTIRRFLDISTAVAGEQNFDLLLAMLLRETLSAAEADFGILYLADNEGLLPMVLVDRNGEKVDKPLPAVLLKEAGLLLGASLAEGRTLSARLLPEDIAAAGLGDLIDINATQHGVAVPLRNRQQNLVGAMLLVRPTPIDDAQLSFIGNLAVSAASSLETRELIKAQKELFEAFIQLIAGAIDAKSPYTGGHCARVPELTKMLARAACAETSGPFKEFQLNDGEWEAVHIAAWLHDCGKVTTPEYVVDKATKLETIYDRIHEVRMRFEVLKRDAEIACLQAIAAGADEAQARAGLSAELARIDDDYAFIASCNEGGEFMAPDKIERLKSIAARTWLRTLDDRIGISHEEKARKAATPAAALPVAEPLLADRPEHVFTRRAQDRMPENNKWGFRMKVPELLYNKGELYNLSVGRGTLSEEERYKINEHIVQTLIMLSALPFPKHLRQIPEIAGGHHEKIDGTGYPRGLKKEDMSPVARMMAIADIFEALTAIDRPYKKGKTLSEAIKIMSSMKKDGHLDADLFELFLRSGAYREYGERFMKPEQIDEVDIAQYLSPAPA
ncbi:MAG: HAMP domain-containing protein [Betaproteobacteria bacterium]|nr:HAMP domain-containing protein [Betaproteobacteria bacterium]